MRTAKKKYQMAAARAKSLPGQLPNYLASPLLRRCLDEDGMRGVGRDLMEIESKYQLDTAEAILIRCVESGTPVPVEYARVIAAEHFKSRKKPLLARARKAEISRITWTALNGALKRGYGIGDGEGQCFDIARRMIVAEGLTGRADLDLDEFKATQTIKTRCYTIIKEKRTNRLDRELLKKFLNTKL